MESLWRSATHQSPHPSTYANIQFWTTPERSGWLTKQGDYIKTWRRRFFILKQGKLLWFKDSVSITQDSVPRGVIDVGSCLTVKGAEDVLHKDCAFEVATDECRMFFVAETEKAKEDWINSIGRSIVQHSKAVTDNEVVDYDNTRRKKMES